MLRSPAVAAPRFVHFVPVPELRRSLGRCFHGRSGRWVGEDYGGTSLPASWLAVVPKKRPGFRFRLGFFGKRRKDGGGSVDPGIWCVFFFFLENLWGSGFKLFPFSFCKNLVNWGKMNQILSELATINQSSHWITSWCWRLWGSFSFGFSSLTYTPEN